MLSSPYYAKNYAGIIDSGLTCADYASIISGIIGMPKHRAYICIIYNASIIDKVFNLYKRLYSIPLSLLSFKTP